MTKRGRVCALLVFLLLFVTVDICSAWVVRCIEVHSCDAITVKRKDRTARVRLYGVRCPEPGTPYAKKATEFTRSMILDQLVLVKEAEEAPDGTILGWVTIGAKMVNFLLISAGLARWDREEAPENEDLARLEYRARFSKTGLWKDADDALQGPNEDSHQ